MSADSRRLSEDGALSLLSRRPYFIADSPAAAAATTNSRVLRASLLSSPAVYCEIEGRGGKKTREMQIKD